MDLFKQMGEVVQEQNAKILKNLESVDIEKEGGDNDK